MPACPLPLPPAPPSVPALDDRGHDAPKLPASDIKICPLTSNYHIFFSWLCLPAKTNTGNRTGIFGGPANRVGLSNALCKRDSHSLCGPDRYSRRRGPTHLFPPPLPPTPGPGQPSSPAAWPPCFSPAQAAYRRCHPGFLAFSFFPHPHPPFPHYCPVTQQHHHKPTLGFRL